MDTKEIIKEYILGENDNEKKERFEIAWDIWENFEGIKFDLRQEFIKELKQNIEQSEEFKDYMVVNHGLIEGKRWGDLIVFKKSWLLSSESKKVGILNYAFEADTTGIFNICIGIVKMKKDIPFKGDWQKQDDIEQKLLNNINQIYNILGGDSKGWKVASEWWIVWKHLDSFYRDMRQREFYLQIIMKNGLKKAINYFFDELLKLKNDTEKYLDEIVHIYLNQGE